MPYRTLRLWGIFTLYIAPVTGFASSVLFLIVYLSPGTSTPSRALMIISPNRLVPLPSDPPNGTANAPSIRMNFLQSCARENNNARWVCTTPSVPPSYDFGVLQNGTLYVSPPTAVSSISFLLFILFWSLIVVLYTLMKHGPKRLSFLRVVIVMRAIAMLGVFIWAAGLFTIAACYASFQFSTLIFNTQLAIGGPVLHASLSTGFTLLWVALGLGLTPLLVMYAELSFFERVKRAKAQAEADKKQADQNRDAKKHMYWAELFRILLSGSHPPGLPLPGGMPPPGGMPLPGGMPVPVGPGGMPVPVGPGGMPLPNPFLNVTARAAGKQRANAEAGPSGSRREEQPSLPIEENSDPPPGGAKSLPGLPPDLPPKEQELVLRNPGGARVAAGPVNLADHMAQSRSGSDDSDSDGPEDMPGLPDDVDRQVLYSLEQLRAVLEEGAPPPLVDPLPQLRARLDDLLDKTVDTKPLSLSPIDWGEILPFPPDNVVAVGPVDLNNNSIGRDPAPSGTVAILEKRLDPHLAFEQARLPNNFDGPVAADPVNPTNLYSLDQLRAVLEEDAPPPLVDPRHKLRAWIDDVVGRTVDTKPLSSSPIDWDEILPFPPDNVVVNPVLEEDALLPLVDPRIQLRALIVGRTADTGSLRSPIDLEEMPLPPDNVVAVDLWHPSGTVAIRPPPNAEGGPSGSGYIPASRNAIAGPSGTGAPDPEASIWGNLRDFFIPNAEAVPPKAVPFGSGYTQPGLSGTGAPDPNWGNLEDDFIPPPASTEPATNRRSGLFSRVFRGRAAKAGGEAESGGQKTKSGGEAAPTPAGPSVTGGKSGRGLFSRAPKAPAPTQARPSGGKSGGLFSRVFGGKVDEVEEVDEELFSPGVLDDMLGRQDEVINIPRDVLEEYLANRQWKT